VAVGQALVQQRGVLGKVYFFVLVLPHSLKYEEVYLHDYASLREARRGLRRYFDYYNHERLHQALGYRTPAQVHVATSAASHGGGSTTS